MKTALWVTALFLVCFARGQQTGQQKKRVVIELPALFGLKRSARVLVLADPNKSKPVSNRIRWNGRQNSPGAVDSQVAPKTTEIPIQTQRQTLNPQPQTAPTTNIAQPNVPSQTTRGNNRRNQNPVNISPVGQDIVNQEAVIQKGGSTDPKRESIFAKPPPAVVNGQSNPPNTVQNENPSPSFVRERPNFVPAASLFVPKVNNAPSPSNQNGGSPIRQNTQQEPIVSNTANNPSASENTGPSGRIQYIGNINVGSIPVVNAKLLSGNSAQSQQPPTPNTIPSVDLTQGPNPNRNRIPLVNQYQGSDLPQETRNAANIQNPNRPIENNVQGTQSNPSNRRLDNAWQNPNVPLWNSRDPQQIDGRFPGSLTVPNVRNRVEQITGNEVRPGSQTFPQLPGGQLRPTQNAMRNPNYRGPLPGGDQSVINQRNPQQANLPNFNSQNQQNLNRPNQPTTNINQRNRNNQQTNQNNQRAGANGSDRAGSIQDPRLPQGQIPRQTTNRNNLFGNMAPPLNNRPNLPNINQLTPEQQLALRNRGFILPGPVDAPNQSQFPNPNGNAAFPPWMLPNAAGNLQQQQNPSAQQQQNQNPMFNIQNRLPGSSDFPLRSFPSIPANPNGFILPNINNMPTTTPEPTEAPEIESPGGVEIEPTSAPSGPLLNWPGGPNLLQNPNFQGLQPGGPAPNAANWLSQLPRLAGWSNRQIDPVTQQNGQQLQPNIPFPQQAPPNPNNINMLQNINNINRNNLNNGQRNGVFNPRMNPSLNAGQPNPNMYPNQQIIIDQNAQNRNLAQQPSEPNSQRRERILNALQPPQQAGLPNGQRNSQTQPPSEVPVRLPNGRRQGIQSAWTPPSNTPQRTPPVTVTTNAPPPSPTSKPNSPIRNQNSAFQPAWRPPVNPGKPNTPNRSPTGSRPDIQAIDQTNRLNPANTQTNSNSSSPTQTPVWNILPDSPLQQGNRVNTNTNGQQQLFDRGGLIPPGQPLSPMGQLSPQMQGMAIHRRLLDQACGPSKIAQQQYQRQYMAFLAMQQQQRQAQMAMFQNPSGTGGQTPNQMSSYLTQMNNMSPMARMMAMRAPESPEINYQCIVSESCGITAQEIRQNVHRSPQADRDCQSRKTGLVCCLG